MGMETSLQPATTRRGPARLLSVVTVAAAGATALFWLVSRMRGGPAGAEAALVLMAAFGVLLAVAGGYGWTMDRVWRRTRAAAVDELTLFKDDFVARVSHELRTPLTGIVAAARTIDLEQLDGDAAVSIGSMVSRSAELSGIVDDLIVAARADAGLLTVEPVPASLMEEVEAVVDYIRLLGGGAAIECQDASVLVDPERFRHILRNLLVNAHRHGLAPVSIRGQASGDHYICQVVDSGEGIDAEVAATMFRRFVHTGASGREAGSLGLGLAVARELAAQMNTEISYRHINGETHFVLIVPLAGVRRRERSRSLRVTPVWTPDTD
ncbi:MAG TPA: HAMP domain-containing sensor histidine kinase [Acidimicrobiia bacterium]|nr:HAMP domain-containing sensor histidine kinase [Acidimicrobiia bacterium]